MAIASALCLGNKKESPMDLRIVQKKTTIHRLKSHKRLAVQGVKGLKNLLRWGGQSRENTGDLPIKSLKEIPTREKQSLRVSIYPLHNDTGHSIYSEYLEFSFLE